MMRFLPIAIGSISIDGIIWGVFIIIVIAGKLAAGAKRLTGKDSSNNFKETGQGYKTPDDELQNFLKGLMGEPSTHTPSPPPIPGPKAKVRIPPSAPLTPARIAKPTEQPTQKPVPASKDPRIDEISEFKHNAIVDMADKHAYDIKRSKIAQNAKQVRSDLGSDLIDKQSLRKAILLKEIFGKPLGMRE